MAGIAAAALLFPMAARALPGDAITFHYDNQRTGWNSAETVLTPATVQSGGFGLLAQVPLDEQVDAQPLYVGGLTIAGGVYNVVFIATENNTVYAIDSATGNILLQQNLGTPVPQAVLPGQCDNNSGVVGINSTPVIDEAAGLIYVMTYTYEASQPVFRLHALSLTTLQDTMPSTIVSASATTKSPALPVALSPVANRQRPALLETSGAIYAGFGSWCDGFANLSRGWVVGWNAATLAPLPAAELTNKRGKAPDNFFLSSIWMSGDGIASDDQGSLFFTTGNSDQSGTTYSSTSNLSESIVKMSADLTTVEDFYTSTDPTYGWRALDKEDGDLGSGGIMLLPAQPGEVPGLAVAAGKYSPMYLLNQAHLGGLGGTNATLGAYPTGGCLCGQSYYTGPDGIGRVVESTGDTVQVWRVQTSPKHKPKLVLESTSPAIVTIPYTGFFTSVSSNGQQPNSAIIWALGRPQYLSDPSITLYAFDPASGSAQIFSDVAGNWPYPQATSDLVPVVANGKVFVATYKSLAIYGLGAAQPKRAFAPPPPPRRFQPDDAPHALHGIVTAMDGTRIILRLRDGRIVPVETAPARHGFLFAQPSVGRGAQVRGDYGAGGLFNAAVVLHARQADKRGLPDY